jgi:large subunit ribosomal protein L23
MKGKTLTRGRIKGKRKDWKKAIVTLKKGESIKIYEGV